MLSGMKVLRLALALGAICAAGGPARAQAPAFDSSGNGLLKGTYYFREVIYVVSDNAGDLSRALAVYGNFNFDGNGNYSLTNGTVFDSNNGTPQSLSTTGTYTIAASGYGYLSSPISQGDTVYGLVSNGIFIGSSTETASQFNDLLIAAPIGSPVPTNATFRGAYTVAGFFPSGKPSGIANAFFQINPDGAGNLGNISLSGYFGGGGTSPFSESYTAIKYSFSSGAAIVSFPVSNSKLFSGSEYLYFSPDGNFFFGGAPDYYDMVVGVRSGSSVNFSGLYYQAGIDEDVSALASQGFGNLDTYYGAFNASGGNIVAADRLLSVFNNSAYASTYATSYPAVLAGTYTTQGVAQYALGSGGAIRIGAGIWPYLGISVALQAPPPNGSGVYLYPTGVVNSASQAPFTAGVSGGDLITLYGSNLAAATVVTPTVPFPTTLGGVQVLIEGVAAPIYYVSPGQISVIVPSGIPYSIAAIQVVNNGVASNTVTQFVNKTSAGVFTQNASGLGYGAVVHNADGTLVTPSNPAVAGEYVQVFVTGLGTVFPTVPDGSAGPADPLSNTVNTMTAFIGGTSAPVAFAGLAPTLAGLYQVNIQIPTGLTAGDNTLDISGPDSYTSQALIPIGSGSAMTTSSLESGGAPGGMRGRRLPKVVNQVTRPAPCLLANSGCAAVKQGSIMRR
jgi:uncharacterized protein (TIGR03437 family)